MTAEPMEHIAVIGLGYVGLPVAITLAEHFDCIGIDIDPNRIAELQNGFDRTHEISGGRLAASKLRLSDRIEDCRDVSIYIVAVPTPVDPANQPDLQSIISATRAVAGTLAKDCGAIIVYESTVYPGITEDICGPEIERVSGLRRGIDFFLGYSPERINPGDREHGIESITKVVAGENPEVVDRLAHIYGAITTGGVYRATSIKVAEAAKVIENAQRDINIAFMNEITQIFGKMGLSIHDVLDTANTKWNFLRFTPGLVGGHCIGVDPYYLSYKAQQLGMLPRVVLAGRSINDAMPYYLADEIHSRLGKPSRILILGLTFKEDVPDLRNSKVVDIILRLQWIGHDVTVHDPLANADDAALEYGLMLSSDALDRRYDALVAAVPHASYRAWDGQRIAGMLEDGGLLADLQGIWRHTALPGNICRWQL